MLYEGPLLGWQGTATCSKSNIQPKGNQFLVGTLHIKASTILQKICYSLFLSQKQIWRLFQPINTHSISQRKDNYLRGLEGVIWGEMNGNQKYTSSIGTIRWTHNCCLPMKHVLCHRPCKSIQINVCQRSIIMGLTWKKVMDDRISTRKHDDAIRFSETNNTVMMIWSFCVLKQISWVHVSWSLRKDVQIYKLTPLENKSMCQAYSAKWWYLYSASWNKMGWLFISLSPPKDSHAKEEIIESRIKESPYSKKR